MARYEKTGEIYLPSAVINQADLKTFIAVLKNAKVDQVDFYQIDRTLYITACSNVTYVNALMKIVLPKFKKEEDREKDLEGVTEIEGVKSFVTPFDEKELHISDNNDTDLFGDMGDLEIPTSDDIEEKRIAFSTEADILNTFTIQDKKINGYNLIIEGDKVTVMTDIFSLPFPTVRFSYDLDYYLSLMRDRKWEKINPHTVNKVAKAVSSLKVNESDMFISVEGSSVYSDNQDVIISAKTDAVKEEYYFGYETIVAFNRMNAKAETASIAMAEGTMFLKVNEIYFAWNYPRNQSSDNIMEMFANDRKDNVMVINSEMIKKLRVFQTLIADKDKDSVVCFKSITEDLVEVTFEDKVLKCNCQCIPGVVLEVDLPFLIKALSLSNSSDPVVRVNLYDANVTHLLIQGEVDIIIGIVSVKREKLSSVDK